MQPIRLKMIPLIFLLASGLFLAACMPVLTTEMSSAQTTVSIESTYPDITSLSELPSTTTTAVEESPALFGKGGPIAQKGDWIYFSVAEMQALDQAFGLYRIRADGSERTLLYPGFRIHSLAIIGDWLYFVQSQTVEDGTPISVALKRVRPDGSSPMDVLTLDGFDVDQLQIKGDWIYLGRYDDTWLQSIQRVRTDGSGLELITEGYSFEAVDQDAIFALSGLNEIVRIDLESGEAAPIGSDTVAGGDFMVSDGWIYFTNESDQWSLYRIRTDGTERQQLTEEPAFNVYLDGGKIFYQMERTEYNMEATGGELVQIELDGSGQQLIMDVSPDEAGFAYLVAALDGWLYLHEITFDEEGAETYRSRLYRIDSTGTSQQEIVAYDCIMAG